MRKMWNRALALLCVLCLIVPAAVLAYGTGNLYQSCGESGHDIYVWREVGGGAGYYDLAQSNAGHTMSNKTCIYCGYQKGADPKQTVNPNYAKSVALQNQAMVLGYSAIGGTATVQVSGNIRCGYSTGAAIVGKAKVGQVFEILDCYISTYGAGATWYLIPYNNGTAWISAGLVSVVPPYGYSVGTAYGNGFVDGTSHATSHGDGYGVGYTQVTPVATQPPVIYYPQPVATQAPVYYYQQPAATQAPVYYYQPAATQAPVYNYQPVASQEPTYTYTQTDNGYAYVQTAPAVTAAPVQSVPVATVAPAASAATPAAAVGKNVIVAQHGFGYTATTTLSQVVGQVLMNEVYTVQDVAYDLNGQCWYSIMWNNARMWIPSYLVNVCQ